MIVVSCHYCRNIFFVLFSNNNYCLVNLQQRKRSYYEYFLTICRLGTPILLGGLLRYFRTDDEANRSEGFQTAVLYATGICVATAINVITLNQAIFGAFHIGGRIRIAVCSVVYRKVILLKNQLYSLGHFELDQFFGVTQSYF